MRDVFVLGAGGHGKVVIATLKALGYQVVAVLDDDEKLWGSGVSGITVAGPMDIVRKSKNPSAVIAVGINETRRKIARRMEGVDWISAVHPSAIVDPSVKIGPGTVIFAGAVIQPDSVLGNHAIINTGATVDHDCLIGNFVHVAPGCNLAGAVTLEEGAFMGIGSRAVPGVTVGTWTTVGAGATVLDDLPGGITAVGTPARSIR